MNQTKEQLIKILEEAQKGEGAFSQDRIVHAGNTIENMKALIKEALEIANNL